MPLTFENGFKAPSLNDIKTVEKSDNDVSLFIKRLSILLRKDRLTDGVLLTVPVSLARLIANLPNSRSDPV